ncbi:iron-sulfur cluster repair protein YtfE (RIC family) [Kibdelosporangium banguiense]|uniref:Iron-sulfur cluster repair protein YtfE (RIC family) n=1 Tax=Kibdelosporangium banguiense TaxID=1365924 RepID=A0ABS4TVZ1_9PSEU|nr:hemerythrin domain-containing protein [Kibdelosporangium banguiense]MBP2328091.1 iron-sulfur cluster repair protein YtfE (RIC family) [Kibdelosporangium banguiense]
MPLDMTAMHAMHDALRRELEHIARVTERIDHDPRHVLRTAIGWQLFKRSLRIHHSAEDDMLWPVLRRRLAGRPDELVLLEAMEAEHAAIGQVVATVDELLTAPDADPLRLGDLTDSLVTGVRGHLTHEERAAIPLIARALSTAQWAAFEHVHSQRIGADAPQVLPWLLENADPQNITRTLSTLPASVRTAYYTRWRPDYSAHDRWTSQA